MRLGAGYNPSGNPNACQPGTFRTGNRELDDGTSHPNRPPTALSGTPPFVSQDARVPAASLSNNAAQIASVMSPQAPTPSVAYSHGAVPAKGTSGDSAVPLGPGTISTNGTSASCAVPIGHGPRSATGTYAHSAVPLSRGINSVTAGRVSNATPLNYGTESCSSRAAPPSHASRNNEAAATARRPLKRTCSSSPLSDKVVAVGLRCGKANSNTLLPGHELAVGLSCGKANTKTPRSLPRLDPVFTRQSSGRFALFPSKVESSRLATLFPFSKRVNGKEPPRVGPRLPPTRAPLMKTPRGSVGPAPSSRTLTHVHQVASLPVEQVGEPTLRDGPVVTPRPPTRSAGRYSRRSTEESHLSSSRRSLEPPAPSAAVRAASCDFSPITEGNTARETVGPDSHRDPEA